MTIWNKGAVLLTASLVLGAGPAAQHQPTPIGAARMPEPAPMGPSQPLAPGPLKPMDAPPGPSAAMSLPSDHTGAFQTENWETESAWYLHAGAKALQRQGLGNLMLGSVSSGVLDTGTVTNATVPAQDLHSLTPDMAWGVCGSLGFLYGSSVFEITGYSIFSNDVTLQSDNQGKLNVGFFNPPLGFEGNNGLFLQADRIRTNLNSRIFNVELNCRYADVGLMDTELIMGVRYLDQLDQLSIFVDDDGLTNVDANGNPDPLRQATYRVSASNRFIAPQLGFEYHRGLLKWMSVGWNFKGAWGVNFAEVENSLQRGDGFTGLNVKQQEVIFSHLYETALFMELHVTDRMKIRGGYNAMWLLQWATAPQNLSFDLSAPTAPNYRFDRNGSIFYHGPQVELQFLF